MFRLILLIAVCVLHICKASPKLYNQEINVNESDARANEAIKNTDHPYLASILVFNTYRCAGVILNKNWILTLASCVSGRKADAISARVGSVYKYYGGEVYSIEKVVIHNKFQHVNLNFDFSLLKVEKAMDFTNASKILIGQNLKSNVSAVTIGWGRSASFKESNVITVDYNQCDSTYKEYGMSVLNNMFCAKSQSNICYIENGDPVVKNGKLYGIFSWSLNCQDERFPGVYANVAAVKKWIKINTKNSVKNNQNIGPK